MHAARNCGDHWPCEPEGNRALHGDSRSKTAGSVCDRKGEKQNIPWLTGREVSQSEEKPMLDQRPIWHVAPRAGFEPATNRLTAGCSTAELPGNAHQRRL